MANAGSVSTNGWDLVYAVRVDRINAQLLALNPGTKSIHMETTAASLEITAGM